MTIVQFTDDQLIVMLEWLENQRDAGYSINDIISMIQDGSAMTSVTVTDKRYTEKEVNTSIGKENGHASNKSKNPALKSVTKQNPNLSGMSKAV